MGLKYVDGKMKKGFFFTMDSILAGGIIIAVILLVSSSYVRDQPNFHLNYLSQDLTKTLSTLTVQEISNVYIEERINGGVITNLDNTVLEQIVEFWADDELEYANKTVSNVTEPFVNNVIGYGMWINNEAIYTRDMPIKKSLVSSKKIISGVEKGKSGGLTRKNPPTLFGPVVFEVRVWQ
ncbi:MAG: hypothetical protein IIB81_00540 [Nanoarchaeota archaeon]|nr:hypothetical protein [Nanoarchaeota archaeon]